MTEIEIKELNDSITWYQNRFNAKCRENKELKEKYLNAVADYEETKSEWQELHNKIDKAINILDSFIKCCKCEKLESGSDYLHHQYWSMFENFNKQVKEILKDGSVDE